MLTLLCYTGNAQPQQEEENLNVFQQWMKWNNPGSLLVNHLQNLATPYYNERSDKIALLKTKEDWQKRQRGIKEDLKTIMEKFPEKSPLNARVTGVIKKDGYRIEKLIYESTPKGYVTGCVFIPDKIKGKVPAVLNVMGHDQEGFRNEIYQTIIINLVKKGMIVLAIDPPGQGEHVQYFNPLVNFSSVGYTVIEHCYLGNQSLLSGISPGKYFIWEGIRAIDYLISRKDVDSERIGVTGFSGGGTITSYLGAYDERVKVSVPCSWSTASKRQFETKGIQDAETVFVSGLKKGISFEDLIEVRAPKPTLMTFVTRDQYLSIQGAREAYREIKKAYETFGKADNLQFVEDDSKHYMTQKIRVAIYAFFLKHFNLSGTPEEEKTDVLSEKELTVTPTGQISTSLGGDMLFDVYKKETELLVSGLEASRKSIDKHLNLVNANAREISGYESPKERKEQPFFNGRYQRPGYSVSKYAIMGDGEYPIPILLFKPADSGLNKKAIIYLHEEGKDVEARPGGEIEQLVKQGYIVAAADALGFGEIKHTAGRGTTDGYAGVIIGKSIVGIQASDIISVAKYLKSRRDVDTTKIGAMAIGRACLPLLHAAAFDSTIQHIVLIKSLTSYRAIAMNRMYKTGFTKVKDGGVQHPYELDFSWGIANVLSAYDLPDLLGCIAPRKTVLVNLQNQLQETATADEITLDMAFPRSVFSYKHAQKNLLVINEKGDLNKLVKWSFE